MSSVEAKVAEELVEGASPEERAALAKWAGALLAARNSNADPFTKARDAFTATIDSSTAWPIIRRLGDAIKRNAWDERSSTERAGVGAAAAMIALFGGTFAVLGALGTAVGTPLWVVFGSGEDLAKRLVDANAQPPLTGL